MLGSLHNRENSDSVPAEPPKFLIKVTEEQGAQGGRHSRAVSPGAESAGLSRIALLDFLLEEWASCGEKRRPALHWTTLL